MSRLELTTISFDDMTLWCNDCVKLHLLCMIERSRFVLNSSCILIGYLYRMLRTSVLFSHVEIFIARLRMQCNNVTMTKLSHGSCVSLLLTRTKQRLFAWAVTSGSVCTYWVSWCVVNTCLRCNDQDDIVETCFVQSCENVLHVRQFVRVCTLMVKSRSSIYARTFSRPLDSYDHSRRENVAWIYVMIVGSFMTARCKEFGCTVSSKLHKRRMFWPVLNSCTAVACAYGFHCQ